MIEINFYAKKKKNYSLLILGSLFTIGVILIATYLFLMSNHLTSKYEANQAQIDQQQPHINDLIQTRSLSNQLNRQSQSFDVIDEGRYPTVFLYEQIRNLLPESNALFIHNYQFLISSGLQLNVRLEGLDQVALVYQSLNELEFITSVRVSTIDLVNPRDRHYLVSFQAEFDRDRLSEVAQND